MRKNGSVKRDVGIFVDVNALGISLVELRAQRKDNCRMNIHPPEAHIDEALQADDEALYLQKLIQRSHCRSHVFGETSNVA
jgi:hypothetical protein